MLLRKAQKIRMSNEANKSIFLEFRILSSVNDICCNICICNSPQKDSVTFKIYNPFTTIRFNKSIFRSKIGNGKPAFLCVVT